MAKVSHKNHKDIRIGTLAQAAAGTDYLKQILPYGFESFQLTFWQVLGGVNLKSLAKDVNALFDSCDDCCDERPVISSLGMFGNPLQDKKNLTCWKKCIENAKLFGCDIVAGFAGAMEGQSVADSMKLYKQVVKPLAKFAADHGVRIAWENCDMGGTFARTTTNIAHSPDAWEMMFNEVPAKNIGFCWEPCHQMYSLVDPIAQLRQWAPKVFHVHGKDATVMWDVIEKYGIRSGKTFVHHRTPGFGDSNWSDIITILRENDFRGSIDIEGWHDPVYNGDLEMTGQVAGLNYLKACRGGDYIPNPK
jgi:sugar phosphate isomerase/epimerase